MALIPIHFERIERFWFVPFQRARISKGVNSGYEWPHSNFDWLKDNLNKRLRKRQLDRCCYCRRALKYDRGLVELDHIIDKGAQKGIPRFTFEAKNLALSCKDCNNNKGTKSVLARPLLANTPYPTQQNAYVWVHPHFHKYSEHILIHQGWVYEAHNGSPNGLAVITKCMLNKLAKKETLNRQVIVDGATDLNDAIARALGLVSEVGLDKLCHELGGYLSEKWKTATPTQIQNEIRRAYNNIKI
ncbi:HNH endonuclease [Pseudomonas fluorescens]|uniref:HNH endonuclease n=1 Tax=Pseudomonas fluorescens TaxID=294 RepID=UPI001BDA1C1A|nr:HNH endonuclease [Pseudomonas fluorescens]MBT0622535.1 HNH endonuclease [Pseudomonas fluorescens]